MLKSEPDTCRKFFSGASEKKMHYYQHHIGDFIRDTSRLSDSQCMAYMRLLWVYYESEKAIENDIDAIAFKIGANALDTHQILKHFFFLHDDGLWHQARCDKEIIEFRGKSEKAKNSANARWINANAMRTHSERNANASVLDANHEPVTSNHKPVKIKEEENKSAPEGVSVQVWQDFQKLRKTLKAPITDTAMLGIKREADKAGLTLDAVLTICVERSWRGFKADWTTKENVSNNNPFAGGM